VRLEAELAQNAMVTLPESKDLDDLDNFLHVFPSLARDGSAITARSTIIAPRCVAS